MRRYELMLVLRPDTADDRVQQILDRTTRGIAASEGQIVKVSPWGRRRLAYPISSYREGSYFIVVFDAPSEAIDELERGLNITEEVMRHLVTRIERPPARRSEKADEGTEETEGAEAAEGTEETEGTEAAEGADEAEADVEAEVADVVDTPPPDDEPEEPEGEVIDESESEAAPKAV
jgi:small subunit ribosomal protein S6